MNCLQLASNIRYVFALSAKPNSYSIGILLKDYNYKSYHIVLKNYNIHAIQLLSKIFLDNDVLTNASKVTLSNSISDGSPIYLFLQTLKKALKFTMTKTTLQKVNARISNYHTSYLSKNNATQDDYNKLYKKLLNYQKCNWITADIDIEIANKSKSIYRIERMLRVCMYYTCLKQYLTSKK